MKIGILPNYNNNKRPFLNTLNFINNYPYRILKNGAIPFGVLFPNGIFNENLLKQYQGFLIPGGNNIYLYHILTIHYAIKNNKPLLGICLGMQAIGLYNYITHHLKKRNLSINYLSISQTYEKIKEKQYLIKIKNHNKENPFYLENLKNSSHKIYPLSKTFKTIYKTTFIAPSLHNYALKRVYDDFIISAISPDGIIEAIEYVKKPLIIGVQFHPELENKNDKLIKYFINACK